MCDISYPIVLFVAAEMPKDQKSHFDWHYWLMSTTSERENGRLRQLLRFLPLELVLVGEKNSSRQESDVETWAVLLD